MRGVNELADIRRRAGIAAAPARVYAALATPAVLGIASGPAAPVVALRLFRATEISRIAKRRANRTRTGARSSSTRRRCSAAAAWPAVSTTWTPFTVKLAGGQPGRIA